MAEIDRAVRRITVVNFTPSGTSSTTELHVGRRRRRRRSRVSRRLRPQERLTRRLMQALSDGARTYLRNHERSNRRRRDGWARDLNRNLARAEERAMDTLIP
jgi:hypothetical protein